MCCRTLHFKMSFEFVIVISHKNTTMCVFDITFKCFTVP